MLNRDGTQVEAVLLAELPRPGSRSEDNAVRRDYSLVRTDTSNPAAVHNQFQRGHACVDGDTSIGLIGMDINIESASFGCPEVVDGDNADLQMYLDGAVNVTQDGSIPPAATLPSDGFFESSDVVGSDFDSWKGSWVFGL